MEKSVNTSQKAGLQALNIKLQTMSFSFRGDSETPPPATLFLLIKDTS